MDTFSTSLPARVVHICPTISGGVADFASILRERMIEFGLREITIPASRSGVAFPEGFVFDREHDVILFHFSGYEYGHRGMCGWIVRLIKGLRQSGQARGLVIYFHELYAFGPPWRSAFWVSAFHRYFVYRLLAVSDKVFTNTQQHVRRLQRLSFRKRDIGCMPVFSTVMEPAVQPDFHQRSNTAVLFGIEDNRKRALRAFGGLKALKAFGIKNVVEIGPGVCVCPQAAEWQFLGRLDKQEVSRVLLSARFGLVTHLPTQLAKSTVFAAYAAHGCIPVIPNHTGDLPEGLRFGLNVISVTHPVHQQTVAELASMSAKIINWYATHTSAIVANAIIADAIKPLFASRSDINSAKLPEQLLAQKTAPAS